MTTNENSAALAEIHHRMVSGANWFYWIAGLSLVNALVSAAGSSWGFAIGLGASLVLTEIAKAYSADPEVAKSVVMLLWLANIASIGFIALCGWLARRPSTVMFMVGMVVFALDTLIFVMVKDWLGVIFHGVALFYLAKGFMAAREYKAAEFAEPAESAVA